jgi:diketogulonate reductase-like aldo/keto reductase
MCFTLVTPSLLGFSTIDQTRRGAQVGGPVVPGNARPSLTTARLPETVAAVETALRTGYRHIDTAAPGKLGVEQIDLLILHQALPGRFELTVDAYRALSPSSTSS